MSDAGDRLRRRFAGLMLRAEVPELADALGFDAIYFEPYTLNDDDALAPFIEANSNEGYAELLIRKARTEDGEAMFDRGDKMVLMECVEAPILRRLGEAIMTEVAPRQGNPGKTAGNGRATTSRVA